MAPPADLEALSPVELKALVLQLLGKVAELEQTVAAQRAEIELGSGKNLGHYAASWVACWPRPKRPSSTAALTWSTRWAPRGDQAHLVSLVMQALTRLLTVPSARDVEIGL